MNREQSLWQDRTRPPEERADDLVARLTLEEKVSQLLHESPAIERLGIPAYNWWSEALHGVARAGRATVFPQAIGMAATFDEDLIGRVASVIADEGRAKYYAAVAAGNRTQYHGLSFWTPNVNIFRDPRWGRGQETYGEDPYLTGRLGLAFVRGLQEGRDGVLKTAACAKHFAVHSGPEALRHEFDARVSPRDLRETYLPAFRTLVIEGKVEAVMGAYNRTNGEPCCASSTLLETILRQEWGFTGHVVSDCWAIRDIHEHHRITANATESVALAIGNGCDLNCGDSFSHAVEAVRDGLLSERDVDRALRNILMTRFKLGILDPDEVDPWRGINAAVVESADHRALSRRVAAESIVLLKNNGILPLKSDLRSIYITGPNAFSPDAMLGNYYGLSRQVVTPVEGIIGRVPDGITVDYRPGTLLDRPNPNPVDWAVFEAGRADVAIAFLGLSGLYEGEEGDAIASAEKGDRREIGIPEVQIDFLRRIKDRGARVVVVLMGGSALAVPEVHELADAVVMAWYPGAEGGNAIADVLFGDVAPSGSLPVTFYRSVSDLPPYEDYSMAGRTYRYFEGDPLYPFGFGLSYTQFRFSGITVSTESATPSDSALAIAASDEPVTVTVAVTVANVGPRDGKVAVQLYLSPPAQSFVVPRASLRGVRKVSLAAGEARAVTMGLDRSAFGLVDDGGVPRLVPGQWLVTVGASSPHSRSQELGAPAPVTARVTVR